MATAISPTPLSFLPDVQNGLGKNNDESHVAAELAANITLFKMQLCQLALSSSKDVPTFEAKKALEMIGKSLSENDSDVDNPNHDNNKVREAARSIDTLNHIEKADYLRCGVRQPDNESASTIEEIKHKVSNNRIMEKYARSQLSLAKINIEKITGDELVNETTPRNGEITTGTSYAELWAAIANAIQTIKEDYVDFYADLMKQYTEMYEAYNEFVQKASSDAVSAGKDGNTVGFDMNKMAEGYTNFDDYVNAHTPAGEVKNWKGMTEQEKNDMRITLEPAYHVNNEGEITFNLDQYNNTVKNTYPSTLNSGSVENGIATPSTSSYQAWLATFNSTGSALQSNMQSFAQRYSQANSTFDNLNKVLSGAISALGESAKDVFKAL